MTQTPTPEPVREKDGEALVRAYASNSWLRVTARKMGVGAREFLRFAKL